MATRITVTGTVRTTDIVLVDTVKGDKICAGKSAKALQTTVLTCVNTSKNVKNTNRKGPEKSLIHVDNESIF